MKIKLGMLALAISLISNCLFGFYVYKMKKRKRVDDQWTCDLMAAQFRHLDECDDRIDAVLWGMDNDCFKPESDAEVLFKMFDGYDSSPLLASSFKSTNGHGCRRPWRFFTKIDDKSIIHSYDIGIHLK